MAVLRRSKVAKKTALERTIAEKRRIVNQLQAEIIKLQKELKDLYSDPSMPTSKRIALKAIDSL